MDFDGLNPPMSSDRKGDTFFGSLSMTTSLALGIAAGLLF